jgi:hypothetical protein
MNLESHHTSLKEKKESKKSLKMASPVLQPLYLLLLLLLLVMLGMDVTFMECTNLLGTLPWFIVLWR